MSDHELLTLLTSAGLKALEQTLKEEELSLPVLRYMALQDSFAADLAELGVEERECMALHRALTEGPAQQDAASRVSGSGSAAGSRSCSVVDAALTAVATTDVVSGVGCGTTDRSSGTVPAPTGWSATQINHVGAAVAPPPRPKSDALLGYLRREGKGHYADPGKIAEGGFNLDAGTIDPNRTWRPRE